MPAFRATTYSRAVGIPRSEPIWCMLSNFSEEWCENLALRDELRRDASLRGTYLLAKERAAAASPEGRVRYNELKGPFLAQVYARLKEMPNGVPPQDEERRLLARLRRSGTSEFMAGIGGRADPSAEASDDQD
jgi:hypothetical protein